MKSGLVETRTAVLCAASLAPHTPHELHAPGLSAAGQARRHCIRLAPGLCAGLLGALTAAAHALEPPTGVVVLTVGGRVRHSNDGRRAQFDMAMLEALAQQVVVTRTPWFSQARRFTGPLLRDVLSAAGAQGTMLRLGALNDYQVDMPFDDAQRHDVIIARLLDDKPMAVRDKGPLFIIYPFDARPELRSAIYYSRSAWQLRTIDVL